MKSGTFRIPLFPLPDVFFLPETLLPLHVFEPRYRALVADADAADRRIGIVAWAEGAGEAPEPKPLRSIGCAAEIVSLDELPDGRSNILLRGLFGFRILEEEPRPESRLYRVVHAERLALAPLGATPAESAARRADLAGTFARLVTLLAPKEHVPGFPEDVPDEGVVHQIAMALSPRGGEAAELEAMESLADRADRVAEKMADLFSRAELLAPFRRDALRASEN